MKPITRSQHDHERCDAMEVEFIGGPYDGARLFLDIVREGPGVMRVLEMRYTRSIGSQYAQERRTT